MQEIYILHHNNHHSNLVNMEIKNNPELGIYQRVFSPHFYAKFMY